MTGTAVAEKLGIGQPAVSIAVARGEVIVRERGLTLDEFRK
jgi:DNA-binding transcriptional LysR family regulator